MSSAARDAELDGGSRFGGLQPCSVARHRDSCGGVSCEALTYMLSEAEPCFTWHFQEKTSRSEFLGSAWIEWRVCFTSCTKRATSANGRLYRLTSRPQWTRSLRESCWNGSVRKRAGALKGRPRIQIEEEQMLNRASMDCTQDPMASPAVALPTPSPTRRRREPRNPEGGRPSRLTIETALKLGQSLGRGQSVEAAAQSAGVGRASVDHWLERGRSGGSRFALRFPIHCVEDLHMARHVGDKHDRGGNDKQVRFYERGSNMHRLWDNDMIERVSRSEDHWLRELSVPPSAQSSESISDGTVEDWATESLAGRESGLQRAPRRASGSSPARSWLMPTSRRTCERCGNGFTRAACGWRWCSMRRSLSDRDRNRSAPI